MAEGVVAMLRRYGVDSVMRAPGLGEGELYYDISMFGLIIFWIFAICRIIKKIKEVVG